MALRGEVVVTGMDGLTGAGIAATVREMWAIPGMDDPAWVEAELERRGHRAFADGEIFEPDDPIGLAVVLNIRRWAILGGCEPTPEAIPTAEQINRGRLVAAMLGE